ncbi:conserved hypothetical protein [Planktothrix agardhii]|nr:conserved hypothetical protein [Planktothrix agardhii]
MTILAIVTTVIIIPLTLEIVVPGVILGIVVLAMISLLGIKP